MIEAEMHVHWRRDGGTATVCFHYVDLESWAITDTKAGPHACEYIKFALSLQRLNNRSGNHILNTGGNDHQLRR